MEKIVRQFILLRYVQNRNRKGEYPNFIEIARKMFSYIGGEYDKQKFERDKKALLDKNWSMILKKKDIITMRKEKTRIILWWTT